MNTTKAVLVGVGAYIASFIIGIITALASGVDMTGPLPDYMWYYGMVNVVLIGVLASLYFFMEEEAGLVAGLQLGGVMVLVSFVLDALMMVPYGMQVGFDQVVSYYSHYLFWVTIVLYVVTCGVVGLIKGR